MRLDHPDYIKLVIGTYKEKRAKNDLSLLLSQPTPANIREECSNIYQKGYEKKDEPTLRAFFGPEDHGKKFLGVIQDFPLKKFKPLDQYLKKEGNKGITIKSLELLAWLIDFQHRPYVFGKDVILNEGEISILNDPENKTLIQLIDPESEDDDLLPAGEEEEENPDPTLINTSFPGPQLAVQKNNIETGRSKRTLLLFLLLVVCTGGTYMLLQQKQDKQLVMGNVNTDSMYWAGDHFDTTPGTGNQNSLHIWPMDSDRLKSFKKITRPDTITDQSIGKVHYLKTNKVLEFFTTGGYHPVYVSRELHPLSRYMYDKYLKPKDTTGNQ